MLAQVLASIPTAAACSAIALCLLALATLIAGRLTTTVTLSRSAALCAIAFFPLGIVATALAQFTSSGYGTKAYWLGRSISATMNWVLPDLAAGFVAILLWLVAGLRLRKAARGRAA